MEYHIVTDTVFPSTVSPFLSNRMSSVFPRSIQKQYLCVSKDELQSVCNSQTTTFVLTAPAQLSGTYASARDALSRFQNTVIIDSKTFGAGQLLLAELTAKAAGSARFSSIVLKRIRALQKRIFCLFTAPYGQADYLSNHDKDKRSACSMFRSVYTIGEEGHVRLYCKIFARSDAEALFLCLKRKLHLSTQPVAVSYYGKSDEAHELCNRIQAAGHALLTAKTIQTDLPFGASGLLSTAILLSEE